MSFPSLAREAVAARLARRASGLASDLAGRFGLPAPAREKPAAPSLMSAVIQEADRAAAQDAQQRAFANVRVHVDLFSPAHAPRFVETAVEAPPQNLTDLMR
jgi:hypothetical protein